MHLLILAAYSFALMVLGLWLGRRVRGASDFFVAGRALGPGLIFSTMLAANIGAGSTVGATAEGYRNGAAVWWWVGSAAIGSTALALWVGPAIRRACAAANLGTVGDYLEFRYDSSVRACATFLLAIGSIFILASQLIGLGWILNVVTGLPKTLGSAIGGVVIAVYFMAGGLLTSARVNVVQLAVKLGGFAVAVPLVIAAAGGWPAITANQAVDSNYWDAWRPGIALPYLFAFAPAFVVSPGLLQKVLGARDDRAVRLGVGANAMGLFLYAPVPVVLGMAAHSMFPELTDNQQALPMILMHALPALVGSLGVAAVFSAEISAADAVLLMLTTSLSQDLYKRFIAPDAPDARVLVVARTATVCSAALGVALAVTSATIVNVLTVFYTIMTVTFFVPIVAGLFVPATTTRDALASIGAGLIGMLAVHIATAGRGWGIITPALAGLVLAVTACAVSHIAGATDGIVSNRRHRR